MAPVSEDCQTCWHGLPSNSHLLHERIPTADFTDEEMEPQEGEVRCPRIQPGTMTLSFD